MQWHLRQFLSTRASADPLMGERQQNCFFFFSCVNRFWDVLLLQFFSFTLKRNEWFGILSWMLKYATISCFAKKADEVCLTTCSNTDKPQWKSIGEMSSQLLAWGSNIGNLLWGEVRMSQRRTSTKIWQWQRVWKRASQYTCWPKSWVLRCQFALRSTKSFTKVSWSDLRQKTTWARCCTRVGCFCGFKVRGLVRSEVLISRQHWRSCKIDPWGMSMMNIKAPGFGVLSSSLVQFLVPVSVRPCHFCGIRIPAGTNSDWSQPSTFSSRSADMLRGAEQYTEMAARVMALSCAVVCLRKNTLKVMEESAIKLFHSRSHAISKPSSLSAIEGTKHVWYLFPNAWNGCGGKANRALQGSLVSCCVQKWMDCNAGTGTGRPLSFRARRWGAFVLWDPNI